MGFVVSVNKYLDFQPPPPPPSAAKPLDNPAVEERLLPAEELHTQPGRLLRMVSGPREQTQRLDRLLQQPN